ncbi:hypothetical protein Trco_006323 [Trichoderma cornu-damae]|uniref:CFEM domain-containing protein n=1 Tax=Trichoderma cornu-damae TaxID=654480 RepID=A0A9P8QF23_9HYPO|nr:hypothetical protein Trco_006323 [Trichoderma cornu-damae]
MNALLRLLILVFVGALAVSASSTPSITSLADKLPPCSLECIVNGVTQGGCALDDLACGCSKINELTKAVSPCLAKAGCTLDEMTRAALAVVQLCESAHLIVNVTSNGPASTTGASPAATTTKSDAGRLPREMGWASAAAVGVWTAMVVSSKSGQGTVVAAIKGVVKAIQRVELGRQLHAFATLRLDAAPIPLAVRGQVHVAQVGRLIADLVLAAEPPARPRWQQAGISQHDGGVDGEAANLEDVLAHGRGVHLLVPAAGGVLVVSGPDAAEARIQPLGGPGGALGHEVGDDVEPFAVPGGDAAPELVGLVAGDLALEAAHDGAQRNGKVAPDGLAGARVDDEPRLDVVGHAADGGPQQVGAQVGSRNVQVGEVGRVRLVDVVVNLQQGRLGFGDHGLEEGARPEARRLAEDDVVEHGVEDAILRIIESAGQPRARSGQEEREGGRRTVHASGSVFQLKMMKKSSSSRDVRPGPVRNDCTNAGQLMRQAA